MAGGSYESDRPWRDRRHGPLCPRAGSGAALFSMEGQTIELSLPCSSRAPRLARAALARMPGIDPIRDDALTVTTELVTNAVVHSASHEHDAITLQLRTSAGGLLISVRDPGRSPDGPHVRGDGLQGHGGLGLVLVQRLARRWDSSDDDGRVVWAQLDLPAPSGRLSANTPST